MKVLMVIDSLRRGGRERRLVELLKGLSAWPSFEVEVVVFSREIAYPELFALGVPLHLVERKPRKDPRGFGRLFRICRAFRPDVVHSWGTMSSIYAIPSCIRLGIPLINANLFDAPGRLPFWDPRLMRARLTFPFSEVILSNSHAGLKAYGAPPAKSKCIHNGFDFRRISGLVPVEEVRRRWQIRTPWVVGMVGAFEPRKDYGTYVAAALSVLKTRQDVCFLAVGEGETRAVAESNIPERYRAGFRFTGMVEDVESLIRAFDVGVLLTNARLHGEGISNAILEYMALGKPVIATDCGGTPEILLPGTTGFLIPDQDAGQLARYIHYLLDHPLWARHMGQAGKVQVEDHFNQENMLRSYQDLYEEVVHPHAVLIS